MPLGWHITVSVTSRAEGSSPIRLATWQSGVGGIRYLDELVTEGLITREGNGYPYVFRGTAVHIFPFVTERPAANRVWRHDPGDILEPGWGRNHLDEEAIAKVQPGDPVTVEVWDES